VARLSMILNEERKYGKGTLPPIEHHGVWDADLAATSAAVVGSILEWPSNSISDAVATTLQALVDFYRLKNALNPSNPLPVMRSSTRSSNNESGMGSRHPSRQ
jgi:DNA helicase-2/ATP-dependent DNA helicase PcrA